MPATALDRSVRRTDPRLLLLAGTILSLSQANIAAAQDATWRSAPGSGDFNTRTNWTPGTVPTGVAIFGASNRTTISFSADTTLGGFTFASDADAYTFNTNRSLTFTGAGIVNSSGQTQTIVHTRGLFFRNASSAGNVTIVNNNSLQFFDSSTAGTANITSTRGSIGFSGSSSAGAARIVTGGTLTFSNASTAGTATIEASGDTGFVGTSTAGSATIRNNGFLRFGQTSTAGVSTIANVSSLGFWDRSTAGNATITNTGYMHFEEDSTAGNATIINDRDLDFFLHSTAGNAALITNLNGTTDFSGSRGPNNDYKLSAGSIAGAGRYVLGRNELTVGGNNASTTVSGSIGAFDHDGALVKIGTGTLTLTGANTFTGATTIRNGTLLVNGSLRGIVRVDGGTLGGVGAVGGVVVEAGGTLSPGASIGTLTVNGPLTFATGSTFAVEIDPNGQSDRVVVAGLANPGGATVSLIKGAGRYSLGTRYTLLTAQGGVIGVFAPVQQDRPFVDFALSYDLNHVYLDVARSQTSFSSAADTPNQIATADGVDALAPTDPLYEAIVWQTSLDGARQAFDALDGQLYPSTLAALQDESLILRRAVLDRTRRSATGAGVWVEGFDSHGEIDGDGNADTLSGDAVGVFMGYDRALSGVAADWRIGVLAGYSSSSYEVDDRPASISGDSVHLAFYGGGEIGAFGVRLGGAYSSADIVADRVVVFPGFSNTLSDTPTAHTRQLFAEAGYDWSAGSVEVEPFVGIAHVDVDLDDVSETGGPAALKAFEADQRITYSTLGARAQAPLRLGGMSAVFRGSLAWRRAFGDTTPEARVGFGASTTPFTIFGAPVARDAALVEAGFDMTVAPNAVLSLSYAGQIADTGANDTIQGSFAIRF